jgi:Family of unknown function (DUF5989)
MRVDFSPLSTFYQPFINPYQPKKMDFFKDLWNFMRERKKFWLLPIIIVLLLLGILLVFGGGSAVAPFIYTLF